MWISMTIYVSGGRADGRAWPEPGDPFEVPDQEGEALVAGRHAVQVEPPAAVSVPKTLPGPASAVPAPQSEPADTASGPPAHSALKQDWVDHAVEQGVPEAEAESSTKAELIEAAEAPEAPEVTVASETPEVSELPVPKPYAPKQAWVDYAMSHGESEDDANMKTKEQLVAKYGSRL